MSYIDDSVVGDLQELELLECLTKATNPLDLSRLSSLRSLMVDDRPGLELPKDLETVYLANSARTDLGIAQRLPSLQRLRVEGQLQRLDLRGISGLPRLNFLYLLDVQCVIDTPLDLPALEHAFLLDRTKGAEDHAIDLSAFSDCSKLVRITVRGSGRVTGLDSLAQLPHLQRVGIVGATPDTSGAALPRDVLHVVP